MEEKKYTILEGNNILASNMTFDMAIVFIKGYKDTYYNEKLDLTIREELNCIKKDYGYQE
jgi:hypothetical protein